MKGTVMYDGATSDSFAVLSGVKQGCVLAPTLLGICFVTLLKYAFGESTEGINLRTMSGGNLFKLSRLRAKTRVYEKDVCDLLFADDAAITTHIREDLQQLLHYFSDVCRHFGLTITLAKMQVMGQDIKEKSSLFIHYKLEVIHEFVYLESTITDNLSIDSEINK